MIGGGGRFPVCTPVSVSVSGSVFPVSVLSSLLHALLLDLLLNELHSFIEKCVSGLLIKPQLLCKGTEVRSRVVIVAPHCFLCLMDCVLFVAQLCCCGWDGSMLLLYICWSADHRAVGSAPAKDRIPKK